MSALDQAIVKAYGQPVASRGTLSSPAPAHAEPPVEPALEPIASVDAVVTAAPENSPVEQRTPNAAKPRRASRARAGNGHTGTGRRAPVAEGTAKGSRRASALVEIPVPQDAPAAAPTGAESSHAAFRPLLEVDGLLWPPGVTRLAGATETALEPLVARLLDRARLQQNVIGWQGCRQGDGCTSLLLATARCLASRGLQLALVDADCRNPRLAQRLGLAPPLGWQDVLTGQIPLAEAAIESLRDRMVVVPWCTAAEEARSAGTPEGDPTPSLETLRQSYDLVLVDLGRRDPADAKFLGPLADTLDLVVLVHNVRRTSPSELDRVCEDLCRVGTAEVAIVENFV